jgi:hypothetical protein
MDRDALNEWRSKQNDPDVQRQSRVGSEDAGIPDILEQKREEGIALEERAPVVYVDHPQALLYATRA